MNGLKRVVQGPTEIEVAALDSLGKKWRDRDPSRPKNETSYASKLAADGKALVESWREVLLNEKHTNDLLAGLTVAAVGLPLNVALAVACGLPASAGLVAGAVGGLIASVFGGSRYSVTGPSTALNVLVLAIATQMGAESVFAAAIVVGVFQMIFFLTRAGGLAKFVPEAVLTGFTTGTGIKLLDSQIPLLLDVDHTVSELVFNLHAPMWLNNVNWFAVISGMFVMMFMIGLRSFPKFPAAIAGLALAVGVSNYLDWDIHRVGEVPSSLPNLAFPSLEFMGWVNLAFLCIPLAILSTVESLLSAQAADRLTGTKKLHSPNLEAAGQSLANIGAGLFGGMPVAAVVVRTGVNIASGGRTKLSSFTHAAILLIAPVFASHYIAIIPIAALAGLLCIIGFRLIEVGTLFGLTRNNRVDAIAFIVAAAGVVTGQLALGLVLAFLIASLGALVKKKKKESDLKRQTAQRPQLGPGIRAKLPSVKIDHFYRSEKGNFRVPDENWESHVLREPVIHPTAFIHEKATIIGQVVVGPGVHIATEAAVRADEGTPFYIGSHTNVQDGVVLHALKKQWVQVGGDKWAIFVGDRVSMAHQCLVHGPSYIGDDTFVGFKAVVHNAVVGKGCYISIGAIVVGVDVPEGRFVPPGMIVDTPEKAQALGPSEYGHHHFNADVVDVNKGLAAAYNKGISPSTTAHHLHQGRCC
jgi:SulP family sulfate permease